MITTDRCFGPLVFFDVLAGACTVEIADHTGWSRPVRLAATAPPQRCPPNLQQPLRRRDVGAGTTVGEMGPIQIFLLGFEDFAATGSIVDELGKLSDAGTIRVIDARLIYKETADELILARLSDLDDDEREELRAAAGALIASAVARGTDGGARSAPCSCD